MKVDLTAGKVIGSVAVPSAPVQLYLTPDGSRLLSADQLPSTWTPTCRAAVRPLS